MHELSGSRKLASIAVGLLIGGNETSHCDGNKGMAR
jgi:hypothetical protein